MRGLIVAALLVVAASSQGTAAQAPSECSPAEGVQFVCGQRAPEDLVVIPGGEWVIVSAYSGAGGIHLVNVRDKTSAVAYPTPTSVERLDARTYGACPGPPDAATKATFFTHGLSLQSGTAAIHRLYVVHHGSRESVEVFEVDARRGTPAFTWIGCVVAPDPIGLNSVRGLPDGGFIATNFLPRGGDASLRTKLTSGEKNGELWEWHPDGAWKIVPGSEASGANGLEISDDGRWLYVAAWGDQSFFRVSWGRSPVERRSIPLGFRVDNVRWAADGSLLAAGQGGTPPAQESIVVKIDPDTLAVQELVRHPNGPAFGAGTVAVEIGRDLWVGSFRGDRIAIFPSRSSMHSAVPDPARAVLPNPTSAVVTGWGTLPDGRVWGSTAGVEIGPDGHVWAYDRCGANECEGSMRAPILKFDRASGTLLASFGGGLFVFPHGLHVDRDGNVWVTDGRGDKTGTRGHQVIKFSPDGKELMRLGRAGVAGRGPDTFNEPTDVITAPNGDIFVADGHSGQYDNPPPDANGRIVKFGKDGRYVKEWGRLGSAPGEFRTPHALAFDSRGRLFVADRGNHRLQIFDQEGALLDIWEQFGRVSGLVIDRNDTLYAIDSESNPTRHPDWRTGVRIGTASEDKVTAFIPPHKTDRFEGAAGEGVTVDRDGNVYAAEGPNSRPVAGGGLTKYVRR